MSGQDGRKKQTCGRKEKKKTLRLLRGVDLDVYAGLCAKVVPVGCPVASKAPGLGR